MNQAYRKHRLVLGASLLVVLATPSLLIFRPVITSEASDKTQKEVAKPSAVVTSKPASSQGSAAVQELARQIDQAIDESDLASARWGVSVRSLDDGSVLYQRNADKLFTPASNMKLYTTGVALDLLGADYRWRTSVYANAQPDANGRISGDLVLYGRGAPDFVSRSNDEDRGSLAKLVEDLYQRGVRSIGGNVIGDASYFRGDPLGEGWQWTDLQWYFAAEASALSINGNEVGVNLVPSTKSDGPPEAKTSESSAYVEVENRMVLSEQGARPTIGVHRGLSDNNIRLWGEFAPGSKGFGVRLSVHNPALWAATMFKDALKARGITVAGQPQARDSRVPQVQRFDPSQAVELAFAVSRPLSEIARKTNKESNNLYAELILRTIGRERDEMAALPNAIGRERGDDEIGLAVMRIWLTRSGVNPEGLALHDGSGLSRLNLVTPESIVNLLRMLSSTASGQVFKESLPVSGRDGTLGGRLKMLTDRVSAKTGSLTYDSSLSGYVTASDGRIFIFSILCNDQTRRADTSGLIDQIVRRVAAFPDVSAEKGQKME
jgi:D-alanyl-D-alanine carboxypeptidase/D-alanyl-D-alanine-endopeptidase (penicillin-binding protein 4)